MIYFNILFINLFFNGFYLQTSSLTTISKSIMNESTTTSIMNELTTTTIMNELTTAGITSTLTLSTTTSTTNTKSIRNESTTTSITNTTVEETSKTLFYIAIGGIISMGILFGLIVFIILFCILLKR